MGSIASSIRVECRQFVYDVPIGWAEPKEIPLVVLALAMTRFESGHDPGRIALECRL